MTVSCTYYWRDTIGLIQLPVGVCSCPQTTVIRVVCWFPRVLAHQHNQRWKLKRESSSLPFWREGRPRRRRVARRRCGKLAVHLCCVCSCRSGSSVVWCHSRGCVAAFKKKQFLGICFSSSGNNYSKLNTLRDLPELALFSFVHPPLGLSSIFNCKRCRCR